MYFYVCDIGIVIVIPIIPIIIIVWNHYTWLYVTVTELDCKYKISLTVYKVLNRFVFLLFAVELYEVKLCNITW